MTRIVLLGGGYVTLHAYRQLARRLTVPILRGDVEVVVISADDAHSFHGFTGEVVAGVLPYARTRTPLVQACPDARFVHARVLSVEPSTRTVTYETVRGCHQRTLGYDHLVVGTGGREPLASVPGLAEHGFVLRGPGEIQRLDERVYAAGLAAEPAARSVVVAGGGLAGVELAAAIADRGRRTGGLHVTLVHCGPALLPELRHQPVLRRRAQLELSRLGVTVRLAVRLECVTPLGARLSDGTFLPAHTVVGTIGQRAVQLPGLGEDLRDERGRLRTAPDLSVAPGVWAAGDAARVAHAVTGDPVPANALWAIKGGAHVGANVARNVLGRPTRAFTYRGLGQAASFGTGRSIAELYGLPLTGSLAWTMRLGFFLRFMPLRRNAAGVLADLARGTRPSGIRGGDRAEPGDLGHGTHSAHVPAYQACPQ